MSHNLRDGQKIKRVDFILGEEGEHTTDDIADIELTMENGQMAMVPYIRWRKKGTRDWTYIAAHHVEFTVEEEDDE